MFATALVAIVASVQPVCSSQQFHITLDHVLQGEREIIASAIFDNYLEQVQALSRDNESDRPTPSEQLDTRFELAQQADALFDDLLSSLSILDNGKDWKRGIADLRRTVLLQSRLVDNPWLAAVWIDLPSMITTTDDTLIQAINSFLIENIDLDRQDRFAALSATLNGDIETCQMIERKAMKRWGEYQKITTPYMTVQLNMIAYPNLDRGDQVFDVKNWIISNVQEVTIVNTTQRQFVLWKTVHNKQNSDVVALVRRARLELGFDPWSRGCGHPTNNTALRLKNDLLRKSAEILELQRSTVKAMLQQLSPEELQRFEERE